MNAPAAAADSDIDIKGDEQQHPARVMIYALPNGDTIEQTLGQPASISELLRNSQRCDLVSDEGPVDPPRYPTE